MRISDWSSDVCSSDLGRQYDAQRLGGVAVELKSHLPIERQARVIGATWLDQQLIGGGSGLGDLGFGADAKQRSEEHTSELQSLMLISYAVFCLKKKRHIHVKSNTHRLSNETNHQ